MNRLLATFVCSFLLANLLSAQIVPSKTYVNPNPEPNMKEQYVPLRLVELIGPEVGPNVFLYNPRSLAFDKNGNLYIFDRSYSKIVKLDNQLKFVRFIGNEGSGPGEFIKGGSAVFISVGPDQKLYANDTRTRKIIVFDLDGRYLADYPLLGNLWQKPTVDKKGNIYTFSGNDNTVKAVNQEGETVVHVSVQPEKIYSFLFQKQHLPEKNLSRFFSHSFLEPDRIMLYFANSSTMLDVENNKIAGSYNILPRDLLQDYQKSLRKATEKNKYVSFELFSKIIPDEDQAGIYYLPFVYNETLNRGLIYQMNVSGKLLKTLYVDYNKAPSYTWFEAKRNGLFYAFITSKQTIGIFKEDTI